jgi:hypothetical protein
MKVYRKVVYCIATGRRIFEDSFEYRGPIAEAAAGAWKLSTKAKRLIGTGGAVMTSNGVTLGVGIFKMSLHKTSASAALLTFSNAGRSTFASVGFEISARGGYVAGGRNIVPASGQWTIGSSANKMKFTYSSIGLVFTASGSALNNIRYAVIRTSSGAGAGKVLCWCTLSTAAFTITSPNTLTILPPAAGVFTMA